MKDTDMRVKLIARYVLLVLISVKAVPALTQAGQIAIDRVEQMPNLPVPYNLRDWKSVAIGYDTFVYDITRTGQYLPLITIQSAGLNYPARASFGMHSYVGTNSPTAGEAINILPSLVGASLCGVNKRDQFGRDWILMSQDYFNKNNGQNLYLNNRGGNSGSDWWYDMMPNIYFYQLYALHGAIGDADFQFTAIADRLAQSVRTMGGSEAPWTPANMDYRAFDFLNQEPNPGGVHEPEAAGAFGWLLYLAYHETGNPAYRKGAEWSMEFLSNWEANPSYELQLPYGLYTAARMNATLGTEYNLEKMVPWSFDRGPLRGWGTIVGKWGSLDVSGLVGEANDNGNDYAFQMNGIQQAAALVPMVRYDKRYGRAIAKWFLNMANATRLMYPRFLPAAYQDATEWSDTYDPEAVIGYEALREKHMGFSPFSTGDAVGGGWAGTNLALYGTSSIGYLGALYKETNISRVLLLDLLKTDFLRDTAYPSWLVFNPHPTAQEITLDVGADPVDVYDVITEEFLLQGVSGQVSVTIPPDEVRSLVYVPAGGTMTIEDNRLLINGVVVDYQQHKESYDSPPRIKGLGAALNTIEFGDTSVIYGTAVDRETSELVYTWSTDGGELKGDGAIVTWTAPETAGSYTITLVVEDEAGQRDTAEVIVNAVAEVNVPPVIDFLTIDRVYAAPGSVVQVTCTAIDPNGDPLSYAWSTEAGQITGNDADVLWTSPLTPGIYAIHVTVSDDEGASTQASLNVLVRIFGPTSGNLIADYPFNGDAQDQSGNAHHGTVSGAKLTEDRYGSAQSAYFFDGNNDHIRVANTPELNFTGGITITGWITPRALPERESFIISHGSWQNRWKVSMTPERRLRWTVKTSGGAVRDVDSQTILQDDVNYQIAVTYDGELMLLYVEGRLEGIATLTGPINTTTNALEIGQMLPDVQDYNFRGDIDDIRIYDYALHPDTIGEMTTALHRVAEQAAVMVYPNPASQTVTLQLHEGIIQGIKLYNRAGAEVPFGTLQRDADKVTISVQDMLPGAYYVAVRTDTGISVARILKITTQ